MNDKSQIDGISNYPLKCGDASLKTPLFSFREFQIIVPQHQSEGLRSSNMISKANEFGERE